MSAPNPPRQRSRRRSTVISLGFLLAYVGLAVVSGIVLVPLYLRHIRSDLYGAWGATGNVLTWLSVLDPGLSAVLQQRVARAFGKNDNAEVASWIGSGLWASGALAVVALVLGLLVSSHLARWMNLPQSVDAQELQGAFRWAVVAAALMLFSYSAYAINRGLQASLSIGLIQTFASAGRIVLVVILIEQGWGLLGIVAPTLGMALTMCVGNVAYLFYRLKRESIRISWRPNKLRELGGLVSFSSLAKASGVALGAVDLFLAGRLVGPEAVNVLRFWKTGPDLAMAVIEKPTVAIQPALAHLVGSGDRERAREMLLKALPVYLWAIGLAVGGFVLLNGAFVRLWVGPKFMADPSLAALVVAAFCATVVTSSVASLCFAAGDIRGMSTAGVLRALIYVPSAIAGGLAWGLPGIVAASVVGTLATEGWYAWWAFGREFRLGGHHAIVPIRAGFQALLAGGSAYFLAGQLAEPQSWRAFAAAGLLFAGLYGGCILVLSREAREMFASLRNSIRGSSGWPPKAMNGSGERNE